jgi:rhodanese-related sulfurtransferase
MVNTSFRIVLYFLVFICGCSAGISDRNLVYVTPDEAATLMREGESSLLKATIPTILIDPRPTWSFRQAHIQGAINIPFGRLRSQSWMIKDAGVIIVAGETYNDSAAMAMCKALLKLGFSDVMILRGGLTGWEDAGEPVEIAE